MEEKELKDLVLTNVDFTKLDTDHVYVFRMKQDFVNNVARETLVETGKLLDEALTDQGVKHVILFGDAFEITELVK